jgi:hypothetical protein
MGAVLTKNFLSHHFCVRVLYVTFAQASARMCMHARARVSSCVCAHARAHACLPCVYVRACARADSAREGSTIDLLL